MMFRILSICLLLHSGLHAQVYTNLQKLQTTFKLKNVGIDVDGRFLQVSGSGQLDMGKLSNSSFSGTIQAASVNTENKTRDKHLREKSDFFNVSRFPVITMKSVKVSDAPTNGSYKMEWLLTIKGITKKVSSDVMINDNGESVMVFTVFKLNRRDWKLGPKSLTMSDEVYVTLSGFFLKQ
jgi:polyisoprenoid-binding protein YceI